MAAAPTCAAVVFRAAPVDEAVAHCNQHAGAPGHVRRVAAQRVRGQAVAAAAHGARQRVEGRRRQRVSQQRLVQAARRALQQRLHSKRRLLLQVGGGQARQRIAQRDARVGW